MEIISILVLGIVVYVIYESVKKSSGTGKNDASDRNVATIQQVEETPDCTVHVPYHKHDYGSRGPETQAEPGLYGTVRRTWITPTGNLMIDDNF